MTRAFVRRWLLPLLPAVAACGLSDPVGIDDVLDPFVQSLDVAGLESLVLESAVQAELELVPGGLTAGSLALRSEGRSGEERLQSRITYIAPSGDVGEIGLLMGDLRVGYDAGTRFWVGGEPVSREVFLEEVRGALNEGHEPAVVAERPVPAEPQAPDDATFVAAALALTGDGAPRLRMDVDADNLELMDAPAEGDPDGWILVLGIRITLRVTDGITELERHDHDFERLEDFEGLVGSVNLDAGTFRVGEDRLLRIVDRTQIVQEDGLLPSLAAVAEALAAGRTVVARGVGTPEGDGADELVAVRVAFRVRDAETPELVEFEGRVAEVSLDRHALALGDGTSVRIGDGTTLVTAEGAAVTLADVHAALGEGLHVVAWGVGQVESRDPLVLKAVRVVVRFAEPEPRGVEEFEGAVRLVEGSSLVLARGLEVVVGDDTEIVPANDLSPSTVAGVAEALAAGRRVVAWGSGRVESMEPHVIAASRVVLRVVIEDFEQDVASIDPTAGGLVLENGWVVEFEDHTEVAAADDGSPTDLAGVDAALGAGDRVRAWGFGFVVGGGEGDDPIVLEAVSVTLRRIPAG